VVCHELQTGRRKWSFPLSSGYDEHSCWPLWQEPYLWISGPFRKGGTLLELTDDINEPVRAVRLAAILWRMISFPACCGRMPFLASMSWNLKAAQLDQLVAFFVASILPQVKNFGRLVTVGPCAMQNCP
jgi:hypothetical protein